MTCSLCGAALRSPNEVEDGLCMECAEPEIGGES